MTLQDITFHLPRGEAGDFNPFTAKSFRMVEAAGLEPALFAVGQYRRGHAIAYTPENGAGRRDRTSVRCLQDSRPAFKRYRQGTGGRIQTSVNLAP